MGIGVGTACHSPFGFLNCEVEEEVVVRVSSQAIYTPRMPCERVEMMLYELFCIQDLKSDGFLEESELIELNESIAVLHYGGDVDRNRVRKKYKDLFREKLHPSGEPVAFGKFRSYMREVLDCIDRDRDAQEMILDQFITEASVARDFIRSHGAVAKGDHWDDGTEFIEGVRPTISPSIRLAPLQPSMRVAPRPLPLDEHSRL